MEKWEHGDCYIEVVIGEVAYSPSVAFKRIDPIAYEVAKRDYESHLRAEFEDDGSHAELFGDEEEWANYLLASLDAFCFIGLERFFIPNLNTNLFNKS